MLLSLFKALADETRLRLAHILFHYELSVNELVHILGMGQSRVSRHLKILTEAGLLRWRRDGLWVFYSAPQTGQGLDFLKVILPFAGNNNQLQADLRLAAQILEERARKTRQFFNNIADDWDDLNHEVLQDFDLTASVLKAIPPDCAVAVDLGCGTGAVLEQIIPKSKIAIGVDGAARMLDMCRTRIGVKDLASGDVSLRIGELSHLPLANNEADFACINLVLHHLSNPVEIFAEVKRILAAGGILFISDFLRHNDESMRLRYGDHWLGFDQREIESSLIALGFEILCSETQPVGKGLCLFLITARQISKTD